MGEMKAALPARSFIRRWWPLALRYMPLVLLLACAVALIALRWNDCMILNAGPPVSDTKGFMAIAQGLRHFTIDPNSYLRPPGFPIILALMPAPIAVVSTIIASTLAFLAALVLLYIAALRYGGVVAATVSGAAWLLLFRFSPDTPMLPLSDNPFVALALLGLLARQPLSIGITSGFAALTRPEGMALVLLLVARQLHWRRALIVLAVAVAVYAPYLVILHSLNGHWLPTGKHEVNWRIAAYRVSGVTEAERRAMHERFGVTPPPTDKRVVAIIGPAKRARARLLMLDVPFRMRVNLNTWWIALQQMAPLPLLALGLLGACALAWYRRIGPLSDTVCLVALSLTWLPYFYIGHRGMLPAFAALALLTGASTIPVVRWVRHIKSAGTL